MGLCPHDLCECETQSNVRGNYVTYQIVYLFLLSVQLLDVIYIYPNIPDYIDNFTSYQTKCNAQLTTSEQQQISSILDDLITLNSLNSKFEYLFMGNYAYISLVLFFFQLCQLDRKCCMQDDPLKQSTRVRLHFRIRLIIRIVIQLLVLVSLTLLGFQTAMLKRQIDLMDQIDCTYTDTSNVQLHFKNLIFTPSLISLCAFAFIMATDNLLYFMKGCILQNLEWGSYHRVLVEEEQQFEPQKYNIREDLDPKAKAYSFGRQESLYRQTQKLSGESFAQSKSPNFDVLVEMKQSNTPGHSLGQ